MAARSKLAAVVTAAGLCLASAAAAAEADRFVVIGTGGVTGVYFPAGGAICRLVNREIDTLHLRCAVESTGGSVANVDALRDGDISFGVVQSDVQYDAVKGTGPFADKDAFDGLRSVFSLHAEPFTVVARADAGIATFDDLKGKRVNIGNPGSGQRSTMEVVMAAKGWAVSDLGEVSELPAADQATALCDGTIDAMVYVVGHPSGAVQSATADCDSVLVPVEGPEIAKLIADHPYYREAVIPGGTYRGNDADVATFGVGAALLTTESEDDETVYQLVRTVFENFDEFRKLHPALAHLDKNEMVSAALTAPLHPGAERYYREAGLMR
ncbi:MAG: TAXI family TRAP transporter solute-binding subunit [Rhodobacteraceae bacterium]|nr:TAXI family TRAP transporter solute-binding subunit [Paracoccaceae bacterium]